MLMPLRADGDFADLQAGSAIEFTKAHRMYALRQSSKGTNCQLQMTLVELARRARNAPAEDATANISMAIGLFDHIRKSDNGTVSYAGGYGVH